MTPGDTFHIALEPLNEEGFAPFGAFIGPSSTPPVFGNPKLQAWHMDFQSDGPVELMFDRFFHREMRFSRMERHVAVTQCFMPLGGMASVMVVAAPTDASQGAPAPEDLRAFLFETHYGLMLWRGTWHALHRFPVAPPHADFALLTDEATQRELEAERRNGRPPALTQVADYGELHGVRFDVTDPLGLIPL